MIDLYTWPTPNGRKISIMLEEIGIKYMVHPINITKGEQHNPEFLKIGPNNKIPVIVDNDNGMSLMETGAILQYLAKKSGQLMPNDETGYWKMQEWLMFQKASVGWFLIDPKSSGLLDRTADSPCSVPGKTTCFGEDLSRTLASGLTSTPMRATQSAAATGGFRAK